MGKNTAIESLDLCGTWNVVKLEGPGPSVVKLKATVPGVVHNDLIRLGKVDEPFYRFAGAFPSMNYMGHREVTW